MRPASLPLPAGLPSRQVTAAGTAARRRNSYGASPPGKPGAVPASQLIRGTGRPSRDRAAEIPSLQSVPLETGRGRGRDGRGRGTATGPRRAPNRARLQANDITLTSTVLFELRLVMPFDIFHVYPWHNIYRMAKWRIAPHINSVSF